MNRREQTRATVLNAVLDGSCTTEEAATILCLSGRSVLRLKGAYREDGPSALAHGNRGRRPVHALRHAFTRPKECSRNLQRSAPKAAAKTHETERDGAAECRNRHLTRG